MRKIKAEHISTSVSDALQYISYYHPLDYIRALGDAYHIEESPAAKDAIAQILMNSRMSAEGHRPICQDTGIVTVFVKWGQDCLLDSSQSLQAIIDEGVRNAYLDPTNPLRASVVADPLFARRNTRDNTPSVLHVEMMPGATVEITVAAKGGGSENKAKFKMLNPSDSLIDWVLETVPAMGAGWCPPGMLGIGVGGTAEKAMLLAKESLMAPINMAQLKARGPISPLEELRIELHDRINSLGIGAQGLGGLTTVLDVKILDWPTHAASKPVALIPNCAATRHAHFTLDGSGPAFLPQPDLSAWPQVRWKPDEGSRRVQLDTLTPEEVGSWKAGDRLLLSGRMLTGRDAAHKRIQDLLADNRPLPVDFKNRVIYYVGPVDPVGSEVVGPAGPTTSTRMDKFTDMMLGLGLLAMVGKAERGASAVASLKRHKRAYLTAVGGAAYLVSRAIRSSRIVAFEDLGMEAIYEFDVHEMPVTVAVTTEGENVHVSGPGKWQRPLINGSRGS
ncbi:hydro-lyase, Fe-S type, tartrate/fumarate subfamily, alpha subunit (plasmid) [Rhizobium leguminosarum bv. trifolii WSM2304]|uniref:Fumarate hydratase class I n=1 Tax=Rhizobium leguminosarum bv. trifolii (strain WSM2304) TaxID=395492 RepID=A0ABF7QZ71_RHILW|nr:fumarate hydratase [Rhizobium leguminosarum]ACI59505.1 hydro-lyase, Fe-S type, tartrate/fumarate subfamily, alpha subunit [Rhizobium leguminosarum bv. trifolii WSM2304]